MQGEAKHPVSQVTQASTQFTIRPGQPADHAFVYATWLRCYKHSSGFARRISDGVFYKFHHEAIRRILERGAALRVCGPDTETILGYSVSEGGTLHFVYVKKPFRRCGIARSLLAPPPLLFTHWTKDWDLMLPNYPDAQYCPYLL